MFVISKLIFFIYKFYTHIYEAKKSKKEQCPKCGKNRTRRTVRRHLKKGCPIKGDRKKSM